MIEAIPRDKYYLYGKLELWIDAETWDGAWNRKFSWQGELVHVYQTHGARQPAGRSAGATRSGCPPARRCGPAPRTSR